MLATGGWAGLQNLPHLANLSGASIWEVVGALAGVLWVVFVVLGSVFLFRRYRRGFEVALTGDGLIVRLPGITDELIPWGDIDAAEIQTSRPESKRQAALVILKSNRKKIAIGGAVCVFHTRSDVSRFVDEVNARVAAVHNDAPADAYVEGGDSDETAM